MPNIKTLPKPKKRFNVNAITVVCGDCNVLMKRWDEPYEPTEEHFYTRCPKCKMHIRHYENTFFRIEENGRVSIEIRWDKDLEWKKEFQQKEKNYYERMKQEKKEMEEFNKAMDAEYRKEMKENNKK